MKLGKFVLTALGWVWFVIGGLFAVFAFSEGGAVSGGLIGLSALFALPLLWERLADTKLNLTLSNRFAGGIITFFVGWGFMISATTSQIETQKQAENAERLANRAKPASQTEDIPGDLSGVLKDIESRIAGHAIIKMKASDYPQLYSRLGKEAFARANTLSPWAAIVAASDSDCTSTVDLVAVSDKSTPDQLHWFVDCEGGTRVEVTESEAVTAKDMWTEPDGVLAKQANVETARRSDEPARSAIDDLDTADEAVIVGSCDRAVTATLNSQGSYDPAWSYDYRKDRASGRVSVTRDFEAQNGFGGTMSSRYECMVDARSRDLVSLRVREPTGWKTLFPK